MSIPLHAALTAPPRMIYFAYGSNLDGAQMAERCPAARFVMPARLDDHRLHFPRRSPIRQCAVASIEPAAGSVVWGALYAVTLACVESLDRREGYDPQKHPGESRYFRSTVKVAPGDGIAVEAIAYVANPSPEPGLPSVEYLAHLIAGAEAFRFPPDYVAMLRTVATEAA